MNRAVELLGLFTIAIGLFVVIGYVLIRTPIGLAGLHYPGDVPPIPAAVLAGEMLAAPMLVGWLAFRGRGPVAAGAMLGLSVHSLFVGFVQLLGFDAWAAGIAIAGVTGLVASALFMARTGEIPRALAFGVLFTARSIALFFAAVALAEILPAG